MADVLAMAKVSAIADYRKCPKYREYRIRTYDPLVPNQVLYQAELIPVRAYRQFIVLPRTVRSRRDLNPRSLA